MLLKLPVTGRHQWSPNIAKARRRTSRGWSPVLARRCRTSPNNIVSEGESRRLTATSDNAVADRRTSPICKLPATSGDCRQPSARTGVCYLKGKTDFCRRLINFVCLLSIFRTRSWSIILCTGKNFCFCYFCYKWVCLLQKARNIILLCSLGVSNNMDHDMDQWRYANVFNHNDGFLTILRFNQHSVSGHQEVVIDG